jgi:hypothetical protein
LQNHPLAGAFLPGNAQSSGTQRRVNWLEEVRIAHASGAR